MAEFDRSQEPVAEGQVPSGPGRSLSILVAEDDRISQLFLTELLTGSGHRVRLVHNGREALAALAGDTFDVVLMDVQMPQLEGPEAARALRARETGVRRVPILALSASATPAEQKRCRDAGMDGFLGKPFAAADLFRAIDAVLTRVAETVPVPAPASSPERRARRLRRMAELFCEEEPALLAGVRQAVAAGDAAVLARTAHKMHGAAAHFSVPTVVEALRRLEAKGRAGDLTDLAAELNELDVALTRLHSVLAQLTAPSQGETGELPR